MQKFSPWIFVAANFGGLCWPLNRMQFFGPPALASFTEAEAPPIFPSSQSACGQHNHHLDPHFNTFFSLWALKRRTVTTVRRSSSTTRISSMMQSRVEKSACTATERSHGPSGPASTTKPQRRRQQRQMQLTWHLRGWKLEPLLSAGLRTSTAEEQREHEAQLVSAVLIMREERN